VWDPATLAAIVAAVEAHRVVVAVDVRDGKATGAGWRDEGRDLATVLDQIGHAGVGRVLVTGISRDGTMEGPDFDLLQETMTEAPQLAVIASGGVGRLDHISQAAALGAEGVIVGRALYEEAFTLEEALAASAAQRTTPIRKPS
jgi:phosphoribosylanthranilate isomerase